MNIIFLNSFRFGDPDASRFIDAVKPFDNVNKPEAIFELVKGLKQIGCWHTSQAFWPMYGGTAGAHKFNLFNPEDSNAAFRLTFVNNPIHNTYGMQPNGTTQYAITYYNPAIHGIANNTCWGLYSRSNINATVIDMGCAINTNRHQLTYLGANPLYRCYSLTDQLNTIGSNTTGLLIGNRASANYLATYRNGAKLGQNINTVISDPVNLAIVLMASNNSGLIQNYSQRQLAIAFAIHGISDTQALQLYNVVQNYQLALGRAV